LEKILLMVSAATVSSQNQTFPVMEKDHGYTLLASLARARGFAADHINTFNEYLHCGIASILCDRPIEVHHAETAIAHKLVLSDVRIAPPSTLEQSGLRRHVTANECVTRRLTYAMRVHATLTYEVKRHGKVIHSRVYLDREVDHVPCMKGCSVATVDDDSGDARADPGGYFVIEGQECVIEGQEQTCCNVPLVSLAPSSKKKDNGVKLELKSQHNRGRPSTFVMMFHTLVQGVCKSCDSGPVSVHIPYTEELPLAMVFRLLGVATLQGMMALIVHADTDPSWFVACVENALTYDAADGFAVSLNDVIRRLAKDRQDDAVKVVENIMCTKLFPHQGVTSAALPFKRRLLGRCARKLLRVAYGLQDPDDRDDYMNRRVAYAGAFFETMHRHYYQEWRKCTAGAMKRSKYLEDAETPPLNIETFVNPHGMAGSHLEKACRTGNFATRHRGQFYGVDGVTQHVVRIEPHALFTHINRLNNPVKRDRPSVAPRLQHVSCFGIVDPIETPDTTMCGLTRAKCPWAGVRVGYPTELLRRIVAPFLDATEPHAVWVNGAMIGCGASHDVMARLRLLRSTRDLPFDVALYVDDDGDLHVEGDAGSLWWPLVRVSKMAAFRRLIRRHPTIDGLWDACLNEGIVEVIHKSEERHHCRVSYDVLDPAKHTHVVLHASQIGSGRGPFSNHNQAPRNTYFHNMLKAAIGGRPRDHHAHFATTSYYLWSPERPLVTTLMDRVLDGGGTATTTVTMVIMCTDGYSMEDSCIVNQRSLDMGLFRGTTTRSVRTTVRTNDTECEQLMLPPEGCSQQLHNDYSKVNPSTGLVETGMQVDNGTVVASKVAIVTARGSESNGGAKTVARDRSLVLKKHRNETAVVDAVVQCKTLKGEQMVRIRTRATDTRPVRGDKFSCLPAYTQVLCRGQGFKRISNVTLDDVVACFNPKTQCIEYHQPSAVHMYNYGVETPLWQYEANGFETTPNHRLCVAGGPPSNPIELVPAHVLRRERDCMHHVMAARHGLNDEDEGMFAVSIWARDNGKDPHEALYAFGTECATRHWVDDPRMTKMKQFKHALWSTRDTWLYTLTRDESEWILRGMMDAVHGDDSTYKRFLGQEDCTEVSCILGTHAGVIIKHWNYQSVNVTWKHHTTKTYDFKDTSRSLTYSGVYCLTVPTGAFVAKGRFVFMTGNSRYGQKATCGRVVPCHDMPYNDATGVAPDLIFNPHGFPSRMTLSQLIAMLGGNVAAATGTEIDGTPYNDLADEDDESADAVFHALGKRLEACGMDPKGLCTYRDGVTGRAFDCKVFEGQIGMMKLKHMAMPKLCARTRGPNNPVTGQPVEGMTQNGGPRVGEMEKDNQIAHGAAGTLTERFMVSSDGKRVPVCRECGQLAVPPRDMGQGYCHSCVKYGTVEMVHMPTAFNLTMQELAALHVDVRLDLAP